MIYGNKDDFDKANMFGQGMPNEAFAQFLSVIVF